MGETKRSAKQSGHVSDDVEQQERVLFIFASFARFHECLALLLLDVRGIPKRHRQLLCILNSRDPLLFHSSES